MSTPVYLELGTKRVFACAFEWPGWCRSGKDERQALEALAAAAPRYALVASAAGQRLPAGPEDFRVSERLPGSASTDFGVPGGVAPADHEALTPAAAARLASLVEASWSVFDRVVAAAPAELRKGPRGGGRDRDQIVEHVLGAEVAYARKLGLRLVQPRGSDRGAVKQFRGAIVGRLRDVKAEVSERDWPLRYAARRIAWHALDHAWEIEDRTQ